MNRAKRLIASQWLHVNPDSDGNIARQAGTILKMTGPIGFRTSLPTRRVHSKQLAGGVRQSSDLFHVKASNTLVPHRPTHKPCNNCSETGSPAVSVCVWAKLGCSMYGSLFLVSRHTHCCSDCLLVPVVETREASNALLEERVSRGPAVPRSGRRCGAKPMFAVDALSPPEQTYPRIFRARLVCWPLHASRNSGSTFSFRPTRQQHWCSSTLGFCRCVHV